MRSSGWPSKKRSSAPPNIGLSTSGAMAVWIDDRRTPHPIMLRNALRGYGAVMGGDVGEEAALADSGSLRAMRWGGCRRRRCRSCPGESLRWPWAALWCRSVKLFTPEPRRAVLADASCQLDAIES